MKQIRNILALLLCLFAFCTPEKIHAQEKFDIDSYHVEIVVHEDGQLDIYEKIDMTFTDYVHGFYRNIPIKYHMDWGNQGKKTYYFPIENIEVINDPYEVEKEIDGVQIRIGDPDQYIYGSKTYEIRYRVQTRDLDIDQDYFYYNLIGEFDCLIKNADFKITFPKSVNIDQLQFYGADHTIINEDGTTLYGHLSEVLRHNQGLTIYLPLGKDYFEFKPIVNPLYPSLALCALILAVCTLLYLKFGRQQAPVVSVEFNAPAGLSSAGVGYVIDGEVNNEDVLSLIIDFADRGYLAIEDREDDTYLTKLHDMNDRASGFEKSFFNALFKEGDKVSTKQLANQHFGDQIQICKELIHNHFHLKQNKIYARGSLTVQIIMVLLGGLAAGLAGFSVVYHAYGMVGLAIIPLFLIWAIISITMVLWIFISRQKHVYSKKKKTVMLFIATLLTFLPTCATFLFLKTQLIAFLIVFAYTAWMTFMIATSSKRSKIGNQWLGQILGLKTFILEAEQERLEMLVHDDPSYFYHILPYAYVLGISDTWSKKFESINIVSPEWYSSSDMSTFSTLYWMSHFNSTMHAFHALPSAITSPKSGSGGFSGGSSGGGFSGGGFGGGSGGSW